MRHIIERFGVNFAREVTFVDLTDLAAFVKEGQHSPYVSPAAVMDAAATLAQAVIDSNTVLAFIR